MLIINADDLGRDQVATDTILGCHARGRVTSTSAMVFMADSERAADLALTSGVDVGLHINFSESLTGANVSPRLRSRHEAVRRFLKVNKYALLVYNPALRDAFARVYEEQYAEFKRLYRREPSHFDGHQHMHLASNMLLQHLLPPGTKVRRSFSFRPGEKSRLNRCYRSVVDRYLKRRHQIVDYFYSLKHYLSGERLKQILVLSDTADVELMTHPQQPNEFDFLMSDTFATLAAGVNLGSYSEWKSAAASTPSLVKA
jgi:predicted glycoside hydrolase/deacetylase ChbG (UPF0249 family)